MSTKNRKWGDTSNHWTKNPIYKDKLREMAEKLKGREPNSGSFKKGQVSPRKGKPLGWIGHSKPHTEESKELMRLNASIRKSELNNKWKGDAICYKGNKALHGWVRRQLGTPSKCEHCGTEEKRMYHWANRSHEYKRDVTDWIRLCVPCHKKYDLIHISTITK